MTAIVLTLGRALILTIALRGTRPSERAEIIRALNAPRLGVHGKEKAPSRPAT
ncbi:hypothetical protein [Amycolatopsis coloradensis]|uniref:hypothetical protein n=1 Tax=Amycolatopsis coloradensis TaxID=76021 RepID=UPI00130189A1|nr:hypothetical protein [Amycolatopsis coloradensis]